MSAPVRGFFGKNGFVPVAAVIVVQRFVRAVPLRGALKVTRH